MIESIVYSLYPRTHLSPLRQSLRGARGTLGWMDQHVASCGPCAYAARPGASGHGRSPSWLLKVQREMVGGGKQGGGGGGIEESEDTDGPYMRAASGGSCDLGTLSSELHPSHWARGPRTPSLRATQDTLPFLPPPK